MNKKYFLFLIPVVIVLIAIILVVTSGNKNDPNLFNVGTSIQDLGLGITLEVEGKTVEEVYDMYMTEFENHTINIYEGDELFDEIPYKDLGLKINLKEELTTIRDMSNQSKKGQVYSLHLTYEIDNAIIADYIETLRCVTEGIPSQDAYTEDDGKEMIVVPEVYGTEINKDILLEILLNAINKSISTIDLNEEKDVYIKPEVTSNNLSLQQTTDIYNNSANLKVEYLLGDTVYTVPEDVVSSWVSVTKYQKLELDEKAMKLYLEDLADEINTYGNDHEFTTINGETVNLNAKTYGWELDVEAEFKQLKTDLKRGKEVSREPIWKNTGVGSYNVDNTTTEYVEIDLKNQHLYVIKDGSIVFECDIVSGNDTSASRTVKGYFKMESKERNETLYCAGKPEIVDYWMPFYKEGIGIHDTSIRTEFGGTIYKNDGTTGCINVSNEDAASIYNAIGKETRIVIY